MDRGVCPGVEQGDVACVISNDLIGRPRLGEAQTVAIDEVGGDVRPDLRVDVEAGEVIGVFELAAGPELTAVGDLLELAALRHAPDEIRAHAADLSDYLNSLHVQYE